MAPFDGTKTFAQQNVHFSCSLSQNVSRIRRQTNKEAARPALPRPSDGPLDLTPILADFSDELSAFGENGARRPTTPILADFSDELSDLGEINM